MRFYKKIEIWWYILADGISAALTWSIFQLLRRVILHQPGTPPVNLFHLNPGFYLGSLSITAGWLVLYFISGTYNDIYQKSRLIELSRTMLTSCIGCLLLFFIFLLHNPVPAQILYYKEFFTLFIIQFVLTFSGRLTILNIVKYQLVNGRVKLNTIIIGANQNAIRLYREIEQRKVGLGYHVTGFIYPQSDGKNGLGSYLPNFGSIDLLEDIIEKNHTQQVILAIEKSEQHRLVDIINRLSEKEVIIKVIPDMYDILSGSVRMNNIFGAVLTEIKPGLMPDWQEHFKRLVDIIGSAVGLILLFPLMAYVALRVRVSSPGPILYKQERIGMKGRKFMILKFRSMYQDAEQHGPALSATEDPRITAWGRIIRQWRLDELPQLWNILKGEMSFVGPRPERKYYIDQILQRNRFYSHLLKVKPGLTSWGMVKFGYAENIDQMIERMKYDLIYLENISLGLDFKIMTHTLLTIFRKQGR
ncbi:MAG TPA: sugar transferase [Chitinophagaceae bacterium]|nr:sugar transferase [Chitinophagaceae bacterium]